MANVLIIVWKWADDITETKLQPKLETDIHDVWHVGQENSEDKVIRVEESKANTEVLKDLIAQYIKDNKVLALLHRHKHTQKDVNTILNTFYSKQIEYKQLQCFLFGEGRDYIYISTQQQGLLGAGGELASQSIMSKEKRLLEINAFNTIMNYYNHEFKRKIYHLKEQLFRHIAYYVVAENDISIKAFRERLKQKEWIYLSLMSLINSWGKQREKRLKAIEKETEESLILDDCASNLNVIYGEKVKKAYTDLKKYLFHEVLNRNVKLYPFTKEVLEELRDHFENLLNAMPEQINL